MTREEAISNLKKLVGFSPKYDEAISTLFPDKQSQLPADVEEAAWKSAEEWKKNPDGSESKELFVAPYVRGFKAGAEWQEQQDLKSMAEIHKNGYNLCKEQMLKDAVKGTVCKDKKCVWIEFIPNALPDYEDIEPVKCVVMKED